jgi:hypothetical protein
VILYTLKQRKVNTTVTAPPADPKITWRHPYSQLVRLQEARQALRYQLIKHRTSITLGYLVKSNPLSTCAYMSHTANFVLRLHSALINDSRPDHNRHVVIDSTGISQATGNGVLVLFSNCSCSFEPGVTQNLKEVMRKKRCSIVAMKCKHINKVYVDRIEKFNEQTFLRVFLLAVSKEFLHFYTWSESKIEKAQIWFCW